MSDNLGNIAAFGRNEEAASVGIWVTVEHGIRLLVARMNNPKYMALLRRLMMPHRSELRLSEKKWRRDGEPELTVDDEKQEKLLQSLIRKAMARHVLLGWENLNEPKRDDEQNVVTDENGDPVLVPIEYSADRAEQLFDEYPAFAEIVMEIANDENTFRESDLEESAGNSSPSSTGSADSQAALIS